MVENVEFAVIRIMFLTKKMKLAANMHWELLQGTHEFKL